LASSSVGAPVRLNACMARAELDDRPEPAQGERVPIVKNLPDRTAVLVDGTIEPIRIGGEATPVFRTVKSGLPDLQRSINAQLGQARVAISTACKTTSLAGG